MRRGPRIRQALLTALLLGHFGLPAAHVAAVAADDAIPAATRVATLHAASPASGAAALHDPTLCTICLASSQARSSVDRAAPAAARPITPAPAASPRELALALPHAPDLDSAAPRAPPALALAFA